MAQPSLGELRFAQRLLSTEMRPRRRQLTPYLMHAFDFAIVLTFVFFLFM